MSWGHHRILRVLAGLLLFAALGGCAGPSFTFGIPPKVEGLERLRPGVSTLADIVGVLGEPRGKGQTLMPVGRSTVWFYDYGEVERGRTRIKSLLVFLVQDWYDGELRYDGYLWFDAERTTSPREK